MFFPLSELRVLRDLRGEIVFSRRFIRLTRESRAGCQELVNGLVKFIRLLRHRKVTGMVQL
jgi:hypothetical protein